jgi:hypothetical protein
MLISPSPLRAIALTLFAVRCPSAQTTPNQQLQDLIVKLGSQDPMVGGVAGQALCKSA